jgi:hypothetical protein
MLLLFLACSTSFALMAARILDDTSVPRVSIVQARKGKGKGKGKEDEKREKTRALLRFFAFCA